MSRSMKSFLQVLIAFVFIVGAFGTAPVQPVKAASANVVISEVYGGGGNAGATYTNDFIELYNLGTAPVNITGWSVQYASITGTSWQVTPLTGTIPVGGYYLVQQAQGAGGTIPLPTPDATGAILMSGTGAKIALVNNSTALSGTIVLPNANIVDFVGWGATASVFEGARAPATTNTTSISRTSVCFDTDNNAGDFSTGAPSPQNSGSELRSCWAGVVGFASTPTNGSQGVALDANIILRFTETVETSGAWYSLTCAVSGTHTASVTTGVKTITLDPDSIFSPGEVCTLVIQGSLLVPTMPYNPSVSFTTIEACGDPYIPINTIQGTGSTSLLVGQNVSTEGVVTSDLQSGKSGFFIQESSPDADSLTSEGLFVSTGTTPQDINPGDRVRVNGTVSESGGLTQINPFTKVLPCGTSVETIIPVELSLPFANTSAANLERVEGMLVHFTQALVINEYYNFDRYGEIILSSKRLDTPTNVVAPGTAAIVLQALNDLDKITLDDGVSAQNPEYLPHPNGGRFCQGTLVGAADCPAANIFRGGDLVANLTAVVDYVAGSWKFVKTQPATYVAANPRLLAPDLVPGELRISSINTLNYFITLDSNTTAGNICGPLGNMECRGAESIAEFDRQRPKTIATVIGMASDITGLLELENDNLTATIALGADYAIKDIVAGLNAAAGSGTYAYIPTGAIGGDAIKAGIVYKPARVTPVGTFATLTSEYDAAFVDTCNRPVLAHTFRDNTTNQIFTVAINHLKSKSGACDTSLAPALDADLGDGQGASNYTRTEAAKVEVAWLESDPTGQGSQMYLIMGDLNSYAMEDPINAIKNGADVTVGTADDYIDLVERFRGIFSYPPSYGYVYSAQAGYLDSAMANKRLASYVLDCKEWHINADEADVLDYNTNFRGVDQQALYNPDPFRSSDHDPILVSLMLNHEPSPVDDAYTTSRGQILVVDAANGVLANDTDANIYDIKSASLVAQPANGQVVMQLDGSFTYTPNPNFVGVDTFQYTMHADPGLMSAYANTATVTITVEFKPFEYYLPIIAK